MFVWLEKLASIFIFSYRKVKKNFSIQFFKNSQRSKHMSHMDATCKVWISLLLLEQLS